MRLRLLALAFGIALGPINRAQAQVSMDASGTGLIILGYDSRTCDGSLEGALHYNSVDGLI